jgi:hypothetical protein
LVGCQFVLDPNCQFHVSSFDLPLTVEDLIELRQGELFIHRAGFHRLMQRLGRILQLPLELVEAGGSAINLPPHVGLLLIREPQFTLVLHDHIRWEHGIGKRISRRWWRRLLLFRLRRLGLLRRNQNHTQKQDRGKGYDQWSDFLFH